MTKNERIIKNVQADKDLMQQLNNFDYYGIDSFILDCTKYISAIKDGRMLVSIGSVSKSGMSRTMSFTSINKADKGFYKKYSRQRYMMMFKVLGYTLARNRETYFSINGCGMDMVFNTNYNNIHKLCSLGFITKKECKVLCQQTPEVV